MALNMTCGRCQYSLVGLPLVGSTRRCPECGHLNPPFVPNRARAGLSWWVWVIVAIVTVPISAMLFNLLLEFVPVIAPRGAVHHLGSSLLTCGLISSLLVGGGSMLALHRLDRWRKGQAWSFGSAFCALISGTLLCGCTTFLFIVGLFIWALSKMNIN